MDAGWAFVAVAIFIILSNIMMMIIMSIKECLDKRRLKKDQ